jgi:galactokinase
LKEAENMLKGNSFSQEAFGGLILKHHENLRDGLGISTPVIERILESAMNNGALGGKINGSGGGGCLFVYAPLENCEKIINEVEKMGYPARKMKQDVGVRKDN